MYGGHSLVQDFPPWTQPPVSPVLQAFTVQVVRQSVISGQERKCDSQGVSVGLRGVGASQFQ